MNLIIDIGNTLVKIAVYNNDKEVYFEHFKNITEDDVNHICSKYNPGKAILSNVGNVPANVLTFLQKMPFFIQLDNKTKLPIKNNYGSPETLGYDRIAAVVGACILFPNKNVLVIDSGTAITYDIITKQLEYMGGAISPGLQLRYNALHNFTAKLPQLEKEDNIKFVGKTTSECIHSGVVNGITGEMNHFIEEISSIYDDCQIVLTGGDSIFFANKLKNSIFVNLKLSIIGLNRILEFNAK